MPARWWCHSSQTASNRSCSLTINQPLYSLQPVSVRGWGRCCLLLRFQVMPVRWWRHSSQTASNRSCSLIINQPLYSLQPASMRGWGRCCLVLRFQVMPARWWRCHSSQTASNRSCSLTINASQMMISYIPSSAIRRSGSARYFSVRHYRIAEKFHDNDADSSLQSMFTFSRPITALLTGALGCARSRPGDLTWHIYLFIHWLTVFGPRGLLSWCA